MNCSRSLYVRACVMSLVMCSGALAVFGQSQVDKPVIKKEDRRPPSEKMAEKSWTIKRKLVQNTVTRYNYYYHAKLKLEGVLKGINTQRQDNYNVFLPFYPFSVDKLSLNGSDLDSVIQKASVAVQIHDPRSKWIDDCYLLVGKAYYYKGDWQEANNTFKYINTTFAPKKKSEYSTVVGRSEDSQLSIASREKEKNWFNRFRHKSARNDAFLWQARVYLEEKKHDEAQSLLNILESDPYFPHRLEGQLAELQAYRFYKQGLYRQTIEPLRLAIKKGKGNRDEKARMSYILGQLYFSQNVPDSAMDAFRSVIAYKPDALMDFNARVQIARANAKVSGANMEQSLAALQKMMRKERFQPFKDALYYNMASIVANDDPNRALEYLHKALKVENPNMLQKTLTFKAIADIHYFQKDYLKAQRYYDSTAAIMGPDFEDASLVTTRKDVLTEVAKRIQLIHDEDSLQRIAALPADQREKLLAQRVVIIRNEKNAPPKKGEDPQQFQAYNNNNRYNNPSSPNSNGEAGDWYFYNVGSKSTGYSEFKRRWGNRQLSDNWRRSQGSSITQSNNNQPITDESPAANAAAALDRLPADSVNSNVLAANLPTTPEKLGESRLRQMDAWYELGKLYHDKLENPRDAIASYDSLLAKFPDNPRKAEIMYSLYVWHEKMGHTQESARYKQIVLSQFSGTNYANYIQFGLPKDEGQERKKAVSAIYESAYLAYLTGNYDTVFTLKKQADSSFGFSSLQSRFDLLEAMAIIKTGTEEEGKNAIQAVIKKYPGDDVILRQATMIQDALNKKKEVVDYLSQLQAVPRDSSGNAIVDENISIRYPWQSPKPDLKDSVAVVPKPATDSVATAVAPPPPPVTPYKLGDEKAANPHFVVMYFTRVSKVLVDEALAQFSKYNAEKHVADKVETSSFVLTPTEIMIIFRLFPSEDKALDYFDEISKTAAAVIIPRIKPTEYKFFIISRENFILLNNTKDIEGYKKFFNTNYITE
ncbi:tetratricopeptide repeat protein [Chitinophaga sp. SYP-B3965]|nr:tetratricopeptide repeat protein [Chitinophaga sp. SYP-B3965]